MPTIEIDGKTIEAAPGTMLIQAADAAGIYIPRFCYHDKLSIAANCRMCLVEVEKAPKPMPACATPVADGMKVYTRSERAVGAQKGTMEFLLINHPLDCPICDQGGECPLQDQAMGFGKGVSRFTERKRAVEDPDLGPLIATEMTRCIHCTRCVRFGQEVAGVMELGATGRGEHMQIGTWVARTVDSEVSGNMIDLCPVGALTSKPYRFTARAWELVGAASISPHDCVGTNLLVQSVHGAVKRVLPRVNEAVNECWLADRDRYAYQGLVSGDRLESPRIRVDGSWREVDWPTALAFVARGIRGVCDDNGPEQFGALASPAATVEEGYLLQKVVRALGSANVDHRLRQIDFSDDDVAPAAPGLGRPIADLAGLRTVLLVGSNIRKDQPLLGLRLRHAALAGCQVYAINPMDWTFHFPLAGRAVVPPSRMDAVLAGVARAAARRLGRSLPEGVEELAATDGSIDSHALNTIADSLIQSGADGMVLLGDSAQSHPRSAALRAVADLLADLAGSSVAVLPEGNGAGAWLAGCVPHRGPGGEDIARSGRSVGGMIGSPLSGYLLLGVEPELDAADGHRFRQALDGARFRVSLSAYVGSALEWADALLPVTPYSENEGTFVNCSGVAQTFQPAVKPRGEARPAWKVLRVLANQLQLPGFEYLDRGEVLAEVGLPEGPVPQRLRAWRLAAGRAEAGEIGDGIRAERVAAVPLYRVDAVVRRAGALQATADNPPPAVHLSAATRAELGLDGVGELRVSGDGPYVTLPVKDDPRVPAGCVYVPMGFEETAPLGAAATLRLAAA